MTLKKLARRALDSAHAMSPGNTDPTRVPVIINSFNQLTYLKIMVEQLERIGCEELIVLDQASTYPPLLDYLDSIDRRVTVIRLRENNGPHWLFTSGLVPSLPDYFIYTDPDIRFPQDMPRTLITDMMRALRSLAAVKVGLALDISRPVKNAILTIGGQQYTIPEWEQQFWSKEIRFNGLELYRAPVDTTFALYDRRRFQAEIRKFRIDGVYYCMDMPGSYRLAGRYTSTHLPWMQDDPVSPEELDFYVATRKVIHNY